MHVSTTEYEFSHGRKPRGEGCWAFAFGNDETPWFVTGCRPYGEAKKAAVAEAKVRREWFVKVLP
jgi:hypothetical protein